MNKTGVWDDTELATGHRHSQLLAEALTKIISHGVVYDLGCGDGFYTDYLNKKGYVCTGFDGNTGRNGDENIVTFDLTNKLDLEKKATILCLEVAEHIPEEFEKRLLENIITNTSGKVILSWAIPGQGGLGHVNERPNYYVQNEFYQRGFRLNGPETELLRAAVKMCPCWWFQNTLLVFDKIM